MENSIEDVVLIYTDGSCVPNPGKGGWGAVLIYNGHQKEIFGGEHQSTNNRMEITACIQALKSLKRPCKVKLFSDSQYVINAMTSWIKKWQTNGWKSGKNPVINSDLWQILLRESFNHEIEWIWIRGHNGNVMNDKADELANIGRTSLR